MGKHDKKQNKENLPIARVTTFIKGLTKKKFFEDIKRQGTTESKLAEEIITKHYL
jgi:hypothetical protein